MTDEPKSNTLAESSPVAEDGSVPSPEIASTTTTVVAPLSPTDAEAPNAEAESDDEAGLKERETKGFDPYRFQRMTVPPGLRSEMAQVKLPRLPNEYFKETLPPPTMKAASETSSTPSEPPKVSTLPIEIGSDAPTVFEPSERTPTSLAVPMSSTPRTVLWGALGLIVGVLLLFVARELMKDEPRLTVPPPEAQRTAAPLVTAFERSTPAVEASESVRSAEPRPDSALLPSAVATPTAPSATSSARALSSSSPAPLSHPEPRKPSGPAAPSSQGQASGPNTKRLWITPR